MIRKTFEETGFNCKCGYNSTFTAKMLPNKILVTVHCDICKNFFAFEKPVQIYTERKGPNLLEQIEMEFTNIEQTEEKQPNEETTEASTQVTDTEEKTELQEKGEISE